jgi:YrbI family 3-deoxy-D-manno-octulosonate 8-phosphate phosphatase
VPHTPAHVLAIIPARGGSERVPRKNARELAGLPLLAHTIRHAREARLVDAVVVSTDDAELAALARDQCADVVLRPAELASAEATSESALLHVLDERRAAGLDDPELVVFLQATSPVRRPGDVDGAIETLRETGADAVFSAAPSHRLIWRGEQTAVTPLTYDPARRPREQDMEPEWYENGSIYVFRPDVLREHGHRLGGRVAVYPMDEWSSFQLDTEEDAQLLEWILRRPELRPPVRWPNPLGLLVLDFDGVLTDNGVLVGDAGSESVRCDRSDGLGIAMLRRAGVEMFVLSTEEHAVVGHRCEKLGLPYRQGLADKAAELERLCAERHIGLGSVVYMGNDVNDLRCLELAGLAVAPADSHPDALAAVDLLLTHSGGRGAVRELADLLLAQLTSSGV